MNDPLGMLGSFKTACPLVTVKSNRSAPTQLATVKWDDEGVIPSETTLVKDGILHDFQTTREQAAWLAPYYGKVGRPVESNGCAASQSGLAITMQHMPNLSLEPSPSPVKLDDLIANVKDGIHLSHSSLEQIDFQGRTGLLLNGRMREIKNGPLGRMIGNGAVQFGTRLPISGVTSLH